MTNAELKAAIVAAVYENTEGAITGDALQDILLKIVDEVAIPELDASSPLEPINFVGTAEQCAARLGMAASQIERLADGVTPLRVLGYSSSLGVAYAEPNWHTPGWGYVIYDINLYVGHISGGEYHITLNDNR